MEYMTGATSQRAPSLPGQLPPQHHSSHQQSPSSPPTSSLLNNLLPSVSNGRVRQSQHQQQAPPPPPPPPILPHIITPQLSPHYPTPPPLHSASSFHNSRSRTAKRVASESSLASHGGDHQSLPLSIIPETGHHHETPPSALTAGTPSANQHFFTGEPAFQSPRSPISRQASLQFHTPRHHPHHQHHHHNHHNHRLPTHSALLHARHSDTDLLSSASSAAFHSSVVGQPGMPSPAPRPKVAKLKFTPTEDSLLIHLKEDKKLTWKQIRDFFPGRTSGTLQVRYCTKLKAKTTVWTDEAIQRLRHALREYENDRWRIIATKLGNGFSPTACREKAEELDEHGLGAEQMFAAAHGHGNGPHAPPRHSHLDHLDHINHHHRHHHDDEDDELESPDHIHDPSMHDTEMHEHHL